jgi:hypothetical protein
MNRVVSFGVLVFFFAVVMLSFQPSAEPVSFVLSIPPFPTWWYRVLGIAAIAISLAFLITAIRTKWSEKAEAWLANQVVYPIWFIIFEGLYTISFLKGIGTVIESSPPKWIVYLAFYFGFALFLYIPVIAFKHWPRKQ